MRSHRDQKNRDRYSNLHEKSIFRYFYIAPIDLTARIEDVEPVRKWGRGYALGRRGINHQLPKPRG